ncbi:MAG TPA: MMPL family transporter, partial [Methylomirabilota bacterium]|nr:MMPL family transporter [Methylomirabilota bacterium]
MDARLPRTPRILTVLALRFPRTVVIGAAVAAALALGLAAARLELRFGHTDLIAAGDHYRQLEAQDRLEFEEVPGRVVVVIRADDAEQATAFVDALGRRWERDARIERLLYRMDLDRLKEKGLWYLSREDLGTLHRTLAEHQERLAEMAGSHSLDDLFARINREITTTLVGRVFTGFLDDEDADAAPPDLTLLLSLLRELTQWLEGSRTYRSPWATALGGGPEGPPRDGHLWSDDGRLLLVLADPRKDPTELNRFAPAIDAMRADIRDLQQTYPRVEVGLTGRAVIEADEMAVAQRDMTLATAVGLVGVAALLVAFLRGLVRPAFATATLLLGCAWALGVATLTVGHLNILTIVFVPMLIGLGDHSIHFLTRFEEERAAGRPLADALGRTFAGTGMGIVAATGTTALAFAMLMLTGFKGLVELGLIS